jgi:CHAT domain-containing protein
MLGAAAGIDARIRRWSEAVAQAPRELAVAAGGAEEKYRAAGERLREAIWDPVARHLKGVRQVFVVPDGALSLVSFATLPAGEGRYLVESGPQLHYLSAERDLVREAKPRGAGNGLLVLGGPDYDSSPEVSAETADAVKAAGDEAVRGAAIGAATQPAVAAAAGTAAGRAALYRGATATCADFRSLKFKPLPGAWLEAREVEALWKEQTTVGKTRPGDVLELMGHRAAEGAFKKTAAGRRVVHLATHAFFAPGGCESALERGEGQGNKASAGGSTPLASGDNPLLLSGLALAGANRRNETKDEAGEDGILTAEEIASLDLSGVEWAVLSACETGVGKVQAGEGVLGLRRAFEVAGAGTLIMSLWSVEDESAREWMKNLYAARLGGSSTAEAVRAASLKVIEARRRAGRSTHPAFWGAFVAAGDWR